MQNMTNLSKILIAVLLFSIGGNIILSVSTNNVWEKSESMEQLYLQVSDQWKAKFDSIYWTNVNAPESPQRDSIFQNLRRIVYINHKDSVIMQEVQDSIVYDSIPGTPVDSVPDTPDPDPDPPVIIEDDFTVLIAGNLNDAEEITGGTLYNSSDDLEMGYVGSWHQWVGLRFPGANIKDGYTITNATLDFYAQRGGSGTQELTIWGALEDYTTFVGNSDISKRKRTQKSVKVKPGPWSKGQRYQFPDLHEIVEEIRSSPSWNSGDPLVFIIKGDGTNTNNRPASAFEDGADKQARLHLETEKYE